MNEQNKIERVESNLNGLAITAISLLVNASLVNIMIGLECIEFNPDPEFLKWSNWLAFGAIAGILDKHIDIRNIITQIIGSRFKIGSKLKLDK